MGKMPKLPKGMAQQLQALQEQLLEAQEELTVTSVIGTAGGGAVKVTVTGDQRCTAVEIDPALLQDPDTEMLQDLIITAVNQAMEASRKIAEARLGPLTPGL